MWRCSPNTNIRGAISRSTKRSDPPAASPGTTRRNRSSSASHITFNNARGHIMTAARSTIKIRFAIRCSAGALVLLTFACSGSKVIPSELEEQIDSSVSFQQIQASPQALQGRTVLLGGEVLGARRVQDGIELEMLQLPVKGDDPPSDRRTDSQGRFLAFSRAGGDPASFPPGIPLTIIGSVTGEETRRLDESTYRYPTVDVKHL